MTQIYQNKSYIIFQSDDGYVIQNIDIDGFAHSHIKNYKTCLWIIELLNKKKVPYNIPKYLLISLIRLTNDEKYLIKLNYLLNKKNNKKQKYYNVKGKVVK